MNLGIYIDGFDDADQIASICTYINECVTTRKLEDASLFYNNIGSNPNPLLCGAFNSTDLWNFSGVLICTSVNCVVVSKNIVNNLDIIYYHGWGPKPSLIELLTFISPEVRIVCRTEDQAQYIRRVMGKDPIGITKNFNGLIEMISGDK